MCSIVNNNLHTLLTIGDVAERTGVRVGTLREWERRHGFPDPIRLPSGHRRYTDEHVAQIRDVLRRQQAGSSLATAISTRVDQAAEQRVTVRRRGRGQFGAAAARVASGDARLEPLDRRRQRVGRWTPTGGRELSASAIYDGCARRWRELARGADVALAFADFDDVRRLESLVEIPIAIASPLHREWAVVSAGESFAACLVGWQWSLGESGFEAIWSVEERSSPPQSNARSTSLARGITLELPDAVTPDVADRSAQAMLARVVNHLDVRPKDSR